MPLPATFTIELGERISTRGQSGMVVRLYSDFPFRTRKDGGPRDPFEREALAKLRRIRPNLSTVSKTCKGCRPSATPRPA